MQMTFVDGKFQKEYEVQSVSRIKRNIGGLMTSVYSVVLQEMEEIDDGYGARYLPSFSVDIPADQTKSFDIGKKFIMTLESK